MILQWKRLVEPARPAGDPVERLQRRLLLGLLLALIGLGVLGIVVYELTSKAVPFAPSAELAAEAVGVAMLVTAYLTAKLGTDRLARTIVLGAPVLLLLALLVLRPEAQNAEALALYLLLPIMLGAALLPLRRATIFAVVLLAIGAAMPAIVPTLRYDARQLDYLAYLVWMGGLALLVARHRDDVERVRREQLEAQEQQYRLLAENVTDIVFRQDMDLNIRYVSPSVQGVSGYTVEEMLHKRMPELMTPDSLARAMAASGDLGQRARHEDVRIPLVEYEYIRKDGSTFWGELRMSFIRDKAKGPIGVLGVLRDVSERKQADAERARLEERLRESDRMRQIGQLAGGVAHDFNNQLAGIRGSAEVLLRKDAISGSPELSELTQGIVQAADRSAQLTRQMLAFARKTNVRMEPINLNELARDTVSMLERSIDKRIGVHLSASDPSPITLGDAAQIHSALLNIALNARDAMPNGGTMEIAIVRTQLDRASGQDLGFDVEPGEYIAVSTRDTGVGLNEETRARMFEPFYTTKEKGRGTGMGLAVVDGTVRAHGGALEVVSTPGQGTTVTLYFRAAAAGSAARPARTPSEPVSAGGTAMVVDDEDAARKATAALLGLLGYRVLTCSSGREAIDLYRRRHAEIDVTVLDVAMASPSGLEVLKEMLVVRPDARVVLASGYSEINDPAIRHAGAFLPKPFSLDDSAAALDTARRARPREA